MVQSGSVNLKWLAWFMAVVIWTQAIYIAATTAYWTFQSIHPLPRWDLWGIIEFLARDQPVTLSWLWSPHNVHRVLIPRLFCLADFNFFRGCGYFVLGLTLLMQIGSALMMVSLSLDVIGRSRDRRPWRVLASGLVACFVSSAAQIQNFTFPFGAFVGMMFFSIFAFFCLKRAIERASRVWIAAGVLAAICSAFCLASGIMTTVIFSAGCWIARVPRRALLSIIAIYVAFIAAYLHGNSGGNSLVMEALLHQRVQMFQYFFVFLGNVWSPQPMTAAIMGSWGLMLLLLVSLFTPFNQTWSDNRSGESGLASADESRLTDGISPALLALFSVAVLIVGQGFMTSLGRVFLGVEQAASSRYATQVCFFWTAVLVLTLALLLNKSSLSYRYIAAYCALLLITVGQTAAQNGNIGEAWAGNSRNFDLAADALRVGVVDLNVFLLVSPVSRPEVVSRYRSFLLEHRLSIFADSRYALLGRHINEVARPSPPGACLGYFDIASGVGVQGGAKVRGWAWSRQEKNAAGLILLVDDAGIIVGLASGGIERPDVVAAIPEINDRRTGWQGYAKEGRAVSAYALIEGSREACMLSGSFNIAPSTP